MKTLHFLFYRFTALTAALIILSACAPSSAEPGRSTPTIDQTAVIEGRLPTINAQLTLFAQDITRNAPTVEAIMTLAATTGPLDPSALTPVTSESPDAPSAPTSDAPFNDVNETTQTNSIAVGESKTGTLNTATEAHNYEFQGTAGQSITIRVTPVNGSDPRVFVVDPSGVEIGRDDDSGGSSGALLTITLSAAGTYIIRVDTWGGGGYTLSVE